MLVPQTYKEYQLLGKELDALTEDERLACLWPLVRADTFALMYYVLSTKNYFDNPGIINHQWLVDRCKEIDEGCNDVLDIWARFHWKSNIKTFAKPIQYALNRPNATICIFSVTRPIAKGFLGQILREFKTNDELRKLSWHPSIGDYTIPERDQDYEKCSLDEGVILRRPGNPKEGTFEAWGLIDSQPTSKHFEICAYDDTVTVESVGTTDMQEKTTNRWELSINLGFPGTQRWYTGTFYSHTDTYHDMMSRGIRLRIHPCYEIDEERTEYSGDKILKLAHHMDRPVLYDGDYLEDLIHKMSGGSESRTAAMQMFCDPNAGLTTGFKLEWINRYEDSPHKIRKGKNVYILVDPAGAKKKDSSFTVMWVVGYGPDGNFYILDCVRDKFNLSEKADKLIQLHYIWKPIEVRYEKYSMQADIQHIEYVQRRRSYHFPILEVGGRLAKDDRIDRLVPAFKEGRFYFPANINYIDYTDEQKDLVESFINEEYLAFPNSQFKDMLDALARLMEPDLPLYAPKGLKFMKEAYPDIDAYDIEWQKQQREASRSGWMGA
jgi:phage terminase large subunit-like protein